MSDEAGLGRGEKMTTLDASAVLDVVGEASAARPIPRPLHPHASAHGSSRARKCELLSACKFRPRCPCRSPFALLPGGSRNLTTSDGRLSGFIRRIGWSFVTRSRLYSLKPWDVVARLESLLRCYSMPEMHLPGPSNLAPRDESTHDVKIFRERTPSAVSLDGFQTCMLPEEMPTWYHGHALLSAERAGDGHGRSRGVRRPVGPRRGFRHGGCDKRRPFGTVRQRPPVRACPHPSHRKPYRRVCVLSGTRPGWHAQQVRENAQVCPVIRANMWELKACARGE